MNRTLSIALKASSALLPLSTIGCGDLLKDPQDIEEPRIIGVQVGDEGASATPSAGEQSTARILLAGPDGPQEARIAYQVCEAVDSSRGVPTCGGEIFAEGELDRGSSLPEIAFTVPNGVDADTRFVVLAAACVSGAPSLADDPVDWSCSGGSEPLNVSFDAWTGSDEPNDNPDLSELSVEVDGEEVSFDDADTEPECAGAATVSGSETHEVAVLLGSGSREAGEWLQVSHFATSGEYERQFSVVEPEEDLQVELEWKAPSSGATKHYLMVRDGLGGVSFRTWSVCAE